MTAFFVSASFWRMIEAVAVFALLLDHIHGMISGLVKRGVSAAVLWAESDADAGRKRDIRCAFDLLVLDGQ